MVTGKTATKSSARVTLKLIDSQRKYKTHINQRSQKTKTWSSGPESQPPEGTRKDSETQYNYEMPRPRDMWEHRDPETETLKHYM